MHVLEGVRGRNIIDGTAVAAAILSQPAVEFWQTQGDGCLCRCGVRPRVSGWK